MDEPYRERGERPPLAPSERRWFTKHGGFEEGPLDWALVVRHAENHTLGPSALIRPEDETGWRSIHDLPELWSRVSPWRARSRLRLVRVNLLPDKSVKGWLRGLLSGS